MRKRKQAIKVSESVIRRKQKIGKFIVIDEKMKAKKKERYKI